jgi:hypothetical protein
MDILPIFEQMMVLLILLVVGVIAAKTGIMDEETNRRFTRFTLLIPQTCMILGSVVNSDLGIGPGQVFGILGMGCVMYAILIALSYLTPIIYRCKPADKGIYSFMTIFGNVGFMGFPVVGSIFGDKAVFYAAMLNIPFNLLAYTIGIAQLNNKGEKMKIQWKLLVNPPLIASVIAIFLLCFNIHVPGPLADSVEMLGDMVVPCSMIIIGASLGSQKMKQVFTDLRAYAFAPMRLIVAPVVLWAILHFFVTDSVFLGTMTVLGAMPVASLATMLSIEYGGNVEMASRTVFVTTVLSVVTVPLICWLLPI